MGHSGGGDYLLDKNFQIANRIASAVKTGQVITCD